MFHFLDNSAFREKTDNCENFKRKRLNKGNFFFRNSKVCNRMASSKKQERTEAVAWRFSVKKVFLEILQNSQESNCARVLLPLACNFINKETLAQVFSNEFCEISKNTFYYRTHRVATSVKKERKFFKLAFILNWHLLKVLKLLVFVLLSVFIISNIMVRKQQC